MAQMIARVYPFKRAKRPRRGMGDAATDAATAAFEDVYMETGDADRAAAAYDNVFMSQTPQQPPASAAQNSTPTTWGLMGETTNWDKLLPSLAAIGASAYTQTQQAKAGIAPPGYTYRGYASSIQSNAGSFAPAGYTYSPVYSPYGQGGQYAGGVLTPTRTSAGFNLDTNTVLVLAALGLLLYKSRDDK